MLGQAFYLTLPVGQACHCWLHMGKLRHREVKFCIQSPMYDEYSTRGDLSCWALCSYSLLSVAADWLWGPPPPLRLQAQTLHTNLYGHIFTVGSRGLTLALAETGGGSSSANSPISTSLICPQALDTEPWQAGLIESSQRTVLILEREL